MDDGRQLLFGIAEIAQQPLDAVEREIDLLGMKRQQPFEDRVLLLSSASSGRRSFCRFGAGLGHRGRNDTRRGRR